MAPVPAPAAASVSQGRVPTSIKDEEPAQDGSGKGEEKGAPGRRDQPLPPHFVVELSSDSEDEDEADIFLHVEQARLRQQIAPPENVHGSGVIEIIDSPGTLLRQLSKASFLIGSRIF